MKRAVWITAITCLLICLAGCSGNYNKAPETSVPPDDTTESRLEEEVPMQETKTKKGTYSVNTPISDVINDPVFREYGRLIFPVDDGYYSGDTLGDLRLTWYNNISPNKTVEIANYMKDHAAVGDVIFYDIYTDEEKAVDSAKEDTGLFFFKGTPEEKFAVCNAGGAFAYVGAMQYTGHSNYTEYDPPTFACVGENDGIANWRTMEQRLNRMAALGIDTEFHHYSGLSHDFGVGTGMVAERWVKEAISFWKKQIE